MIEKKTGDMSKSLILEAIPSKKVNWKQICQYYLLSFIFIFIF